MSGERECYLFLVEEGREGGGRRPIQVKRIARREGERARESREGGLRQK